jgi:EAL domain-containing protein (putative c-di-GMP-specific phosphodiesterase class I)/ActR/RegA family two-component response regulator
MSTSSSSTGPPAEKWGARCAYILDDEVEIGILVAQVLSTCGIASRQFTMPVPFFKEFELSRPDLVVLDLALGQSDAVEIIRRLEVLKYKGSILLVSGRDAATLAEIAQIGERHGMVMLEPLRKPFRANDIRRSLAGHNPETRIEPKTAFPTPSPPKQIKVQLTEALRKNWLELWYQPKVDLRSLSVAGAEGLLRARHPELGIVLPENILPPPGDPSYAPLSAFVVERAARDWKRFADQGLRLKLAVNVPISVLISPDFIRLVRRNLPQDPDFPGLVLEITEDEVIRDPQWTREIATQLKLYNVHISIDDFGAAYASMARLNDLPVSEVKIDRSFVANCSSDESRRVLCQTVVDLAHRFGASVCAEGVETAEDLRALVDMGADTAQGFLFAKPMTADALVQKLLASSAGAMRGPLAMPSGHKIPPHRLA